MFGSSDGNIVAYSNFSGNAPKQKTTFGQISASPQTKFSYQTYIASFPVDTFQSDQQRHRFGKQSYPSAKRGKRNRKADGADAESDRGAKIANRKVPAVKEMHR